jgi:hypothetical protein
VEPPDGEFAVKKVPSGFQLGSSYPSSNKETQVSGSPRVASSSRINARVTREGVKDSAGKKREPLLSRRRAPVEAWPMASEAIYHIHPNTPIHVQYVNKKGVKNTYHGTCIHYEYETN